jgi:threonine dehydrogenase-like Zn-dependent dehydrogenase
MKAVVYEGPFNIACGTCRNCVAGPAAQVCRQRAG